MVLKNGLLQPYLVHVLGCKWCKSKVFSCVKPSRFECRSETSRIVKSVEMTERPHLSLLHAAHFGWRVDIFIVPKKTENLSVDMKNSSSNP